MQENIKMVNSYYYDGNQYIPRTQGDSSKGFILASIASSAIMGTLPAFSKPFSSQLIKELKRYCERYEIGGNFTKFLN